jgi:uncharacterized protein (UPF0262 family)
MGEPANGAAFDKRSRIATIELDEKIVLRHSADVEHERRIAIFDLLENNYFRPVGPQDGPFNLVLGVEENRLVFDISVVGDDECRRIVLSLVPFRRIVKDYFLVCESYFSAIKNASIQQIEAIDMGRRSLHNEGSELLKERLKDKIEVDFDTARRLFTLICVLHVRG